MVVVLVVPLGLAVVPLFREHQAGSAVVVVLVDGLGVVVVVVVVPQLWEVMLQAWLLALHVMMQVPAQGVGGGAVVGVLSVQELSPVPRPSISHCSLSSYQVTVAYVPAGTLPVAPRTDPATMFI